MGKELFSSEKNFGLQLKTQFLLSEVYDNLKNLTRFDVKCENGQIFTIGAKPGRLLILTKEAKGNFVSTEELLKDRVLRFIYQRSYLGMTLPHHLNNYAAEINKTFRTAGLIKQGEKLVTGNNVHGYKYLGK